MPKSPRESPLNPRKEGRRRAFREHFLEESRQSFLSGWLRFTTKGRATVCSIPVATQANVPGRGNGVSESWEHERPWHVAGTGVRRGPETWKQVLGATGTVSRRET